MRAPEGGARSPAEPSRAPIRASRSFLVLETGVLLLGTLGRWRSQLTCYVAERTARRLGRVALPLLARRREGQCVQAEGFLSFWGIVALDAGVWRSRRLAMSPSALSAD